MDYKKMWYMMKENLLRESQRRELGTIRMDAIEQHLKIMDDIEVKAMKESQHVCECGGEKTLCNPKPEKETGNKREPWGKTASGKCKDTEKPEDGKDILRKIFGDDFVSDLETLEKKIAEGKEPVIMVDGDLEIPDNLERAAREKNISIAHVHCGAFEIGAGIPFPFPFPPGFLK